MLVLGIETSCDETAAAVVRDDRTVLADVVLSQLDDHRPYGGVVPEIAARAHLVHLDRVIGQALARSGVSLARLDAVAATGGPGLIGGLIVGVTTAKALAMVAGKPFVAVNHLEAHALTARLTDNLAFPYLLLLASGGHCQLVVVEDVGRYRRLGATVDDAAGEAFDKVAKMLGLGYPGGPAVERAAVGGDPLRFALPRPMKGRADCDFSFSGLKNAVRLLIAEVKPLDEQARCDVAAAFELAVAESVADRVRNAMKHFWAAYSPAGAGHLVVAGGVAANLRLRRTLAAAAGEAGFTLVAPPPALCTDNASMVAWAGLERFRRGHADGLDFAPRPRWPLDPQAKRLRGAGVKA